MFSGLLGRGDRISCVSHFLGGQQGKGTSEKRAWAIAQIRKILVYLGRVSEPRVVPRAGRMRRAVGVGWSWKGLQGLHQGGLTPLDWRVCEQGQVPEWKELLGGPPGSYGA